MSEQAPGYSKNFNMNQVILVQEEPMICSELVEVIIKPTDAGLFDIPIPESQQLKSDTDQTIITKAVRLVSLDALAFGVISGFPNAPITELQKISLTLYSQGWEKGHNIPILTLNDVVGPSTGTPYRYHQQKFADWRKVAWDNRSFLKYSNGSGGAVPGATGYVVMLQVDYVRINANGEIFEGPQP